jgi:poly(3-hydroxybutyrate) depolymerase
LQSSIVSEQWKTNIKKGIMGKATIPLLSWTLFTLAVLTTTTTPLQALGYNDRYCVNTDASFESGHGCWVYHDTGENEDKPIRVWYYYPVTFSSGSHKVVFAMHGSKRNAKNAIARWQRYADEFGALIIAPEFSLHHYPSAAQYNRGNVIDAEGEIESPADWTFTTIEEIFDQVIRLVPDAPQRYSIQGHSAGGQFVHRMALLADNFRIETAVAANPGWYLLPDENNYYPCGIADLPPQAVDLATAYAGNLVITLGTEDNDPDADGLNHSSCAEMQGTNRYDRGHFFYEYARKDALNRSLPFNWKLVEVEGVGHDADAMVHAGADEILGMPYDQHPLLLKPTQDATVKANYANSNYGLRDTLQVDGQSLKTTYLQFDLRNVANVNAAILRVDVSDPSSGQQSIHEANSNHWSETGLTFNNQPGIADLITTLNGSATGELSIDLSNFIQSRLGQVITVVLSTPDADGLYFKSRESSTPPILEVYQ